jgi:hypothetical protein
LNWGSERLTRFQAIGNESERMSEQSSGALRQSQPRIDDNAEERGLHSSPCDSLKKSGFVELL